jgi:hypothetical protein
MKSIVAEYSLCGGSMIEMKCSPLQNRFLYILRHLAIIVYGEIAKSVKMDKLNFSKPLRFFWSDERYCEIQSDDTDTANILKNVLSEFSFFKFPLFAQFEDPLAVLSFLVHEYH